MPLAAAVLAGLLSASSCWDVYDAAMHRSAQAVQPRFVSYDENIWVRAYQKDVVHERTHVDYRGDGLAIVQDPRYGPRPVLTRELEPGPPLLGPYGSSKARWQLRDPSELQTISDVRVTGDERCENAGVVQLDGAPVFHLIFHRDDSSSAGLKELWVDANTAEIRRVVITGPVVYLGTRDRARLADFDVRVKVVDGYSVITRVTWWQGFYVGEYTLQNFSFPPDVTAFDGI